MDVIVPQTEDNYQEPNPDCPVCHGTGHKTIHDQHLGVDKEETCKCVLLHQKKLAAEARIRKTFGAQAERYSFANYQTGGDAFNEQALLAAKNYVNDFILFLEKGYGFGLSGPSRSGKTHLITATLIALIKRWNIKPFILSVPRLMRLEKERFDNPDIVSPVELAISAHICVLDDLGAEYKKQGQVLTHQLNWAEEIIYLLLDERIKKSLPVLYTTNLTVGELDTVLPERLSTRLKNITINNYPLTRVEGVAEPEADLVALLNKKK